MIKLVGELRDYAITFSKRRDIIYDIEAIKNYNIIEKVLSADIENKEELIHKIDATFAFSIIKPPSLQLLSTIKALTSPFTWNSNLFAECVWLKIVGGKSLIKGVNMLCRRGCEFERGGRGT